MTLRKNESDRSAPPASPSDVVGFESRYGITLPEDYKEFLIHQDVIRPGYNNYFYKSSSGKVYFLSMENTFSDDLKLLEDSFAEFLDGLVSEDEI